MKVNAKYVNPFIEAAMKVVNQIAGIEVRRGHLSYKPRVEPSYGVSIIIGIYGFLVGQIVYSLEGELAERLVDRLLGGKSPQEKKIMFIDTLGEVANMITGNATALLNQKKDLSLKITTPAIATGEHLSINLVPKPALVLGLYTQYGPIEISIALEEQDALSEVEAFDAVLAGDLRRMNVTAEYRAVFAEEAKENLAGMGSGLCWPWRAVPAMPELVHQLFRAVHTLKGSAGFIGFAQAAAPRPRPGVRPAERAGRERKPERRHRRSCYSAAWILAGA